jgi:hypothetical protein
MRSICGFMPTPPNTTVELISQVFAVVAHRFLDLGGQFAGGRQHQGANALAAELALGGGPAPEADAASAG